MGEEISQGEAGGWHLRPRGLVHSFWNTGKVPAKFIELYISGGHEAYMQELPTVFPHGRTPKPEEVNTLLKSMISSFSGINCQPFPKRIKSIYKQASFKKTKDQ